MSADNRLCRAVIDMQGEKFRPGIMTDRIHHSLALHDQRHVAIGDEQAFPLRQRRHDMLALRRDDCGVAPAADGHAMGFIRGDTGALLVGQPAGRVDDEAAAFQRMVANLHFGLIGEGRAEQRAWEH